MTKARKQRLAEARKWFPEQNFAEDSHIVKAYRKRFSVDVNCAMLELCMLGVLSHEKQKSYEQQLAAKKWKSTEKRNKKQDEVNINPYQDENFFFIAGYTPGGVPYGITWEEKAEIERREGLGDEPVEDYGDAEKLEGEDRADPEDHPILNIPDGIIKALPF